MTIEEAKKGQKLLTKIEALDKAINNIKRNATYISPAVIREFKEDFIAMFSAMREKYSQELNGLCSNRE